MSETKMNVIKSNDYWTWQWDGSTQKDISRGKPCHESPPTLTSYRWDVGVAHFVIKIGPDLMACGQLIAKFPRHFGVRISKEDKNWLYCASKGFQGATSLQNIFLSQPQTVQNGRFQRTTMALPCRTTPAI